MGLRIPDVLGPERMRDRKPAEPEHAGHRAGQRLEPVHPERIEAPDQHQDRNCRDESDDDVEAEVREDRQQEARTSSGR